MPQLLVLCGVKLTGMDGMRIQLVVELAMVAVPMLLCALARKAPSKRRAAVSCNG